ncbi:hypothetical protein [Thermus phage TSP4]|nr:hypothetical protein [Thermus phage TSP4]
MPTRLSVSVYDYSYGYSPDLLAQAYIRLTNDSLRSFKAFKANILQFAQQLDCHGHQPVLIVLQKRFRPLVDLSRAKDVFAWNSDRMLKFNDDFTKYLTAVLATYLGRHIDSLPQVNLWIPPDYDTYRLVRKTRTYSVLIRQSDVLLSTKSRLDFVNGLKFLQPYSDRPWKIYWLENGYRRICTIDKLI